MAGYSHHILGQSEGMLPQENLNFNITLVEWFWRILSTLVHE